MRGSNGAVYVLDCGLGLTDRFAEAGLSFNAVRAVYITHHHFDHNVEYGPFLAIGWVQGMPLSVRAYGPPPLKQMTADYIRSMQTTIGFWSEDLKMKPLETIDVTEVPQAGPVMQDDNVKVSATVVQHPPVKPALGYRFDFHDRSMPFPATRRRSRPSRNWPKAPTSWFTRRCICRPGRYLMRRSPRAGRSNSTTTWAYERRSLAGRRGRPHRAGSGRQDARLSHLTPAIDSISDDTWRAAAAAKFKGEIVVGHDFTVV